MTISVSVLSHAFLTERGVSRATPPNCSRDLCSDVVSRDDSLDPQAEMKVDCIACGCTQGRDVDYLAATPRMHSTGCYSCREYAMSPRSVTVASPSPRMTLAAASPSPRLLAVASPSPRMGGGKSQGKKKGNKKRGARKRAQDGESKEAKVMQVATLTTVDRGVEGAQIGACTCRGHGGLGDVGLEGRQTGACACCGGQGIVGAFEGTQAQACMCRGTGGSADAHMEVDVVLGDVREECSSALGIVKEDLELFGLCHMPCASERATLLKDKSGLVRMGVMVRNSDLNLQSIEELIIRKDKAEQEAESYRLQVSEKTQDFNNLKLKYDKLTQEVLRLRTMVNRANQLRRESEKATEILRVEFEKLVKTLFMDCSSQSLEETQPNKEIENIQI